MLDRCKPSQGLPTMPNGTYRSLLSDDSVCTVPRYSSLLADGFKSFPSGHTSFAFCGMVFLARYTAEACVELADSLSHRYSSAQDDAEAQEPADRPNEHSTYVPSADSHMALLPSPTREARQPLQKAMLATAVVVPFLLIMCASLVGISRTMDYRHHSTDVIAGAILGTLIAESVYKVYHCALLPDDDT